MKTFARVAVVVTLMLLGGGSAPAVSAQGPEGSVLAPVGRQAGWLNLEAPRPRFLTHFDPPDYVADVSVAPDSIRAAIVVVHVPPSSGVTYGEIMALDLTTSTVSPLVVAQAASESLGAPVWWPDGTRLLFQREDVSVIGTSYAGGATVQYPSRIEQVNADGSARTIVVDDGRQPASGADREHLAYVRRSDQGPALVTRSLIDGSERIIIAAGQFGDIASPRYAPGGDRIAFMAPVGLAPQAGSPLLAGARFAAPLRLAHGTPWDLWVVNADASGSAVRLAALAADDGTLAWSPDGSHVFVYGGTGSFIVDVSTGEVAPLTFVTGYGATSWISD
jgi:Tol biopolymer transport system component